MPQTEGCRCPLCLGIGMAVGVTAGRDGACCRPAEDNGSGSDSDTCRESSETSCCRGRWQEIQGGNSGVGQSSRLSCLPGFAAVETVHDSGNRYKCVKVRAVKPFAAVPIKMF